MCTDDIDEATNRCECYNTCFNIKFSIHGKNSLNWLQENKLRVELNKPKMRLVRHALQSITDVIGNLMRFGIQTHFLICTIFHGISAGIGAVFSFLMGTSILSVFEVVYLSCLHRTKNVAAPQQMSNNIH